MASEVAAAGRGEEAQRAPKTKVFISYSRKNMAFADRLEAALKERGFEPLIDRTEIYAFEDWWKRIQALIAQADTIIFVLSPDAVASEVCAKEVAYAASLNKRFAPIVLRRVDDKLLPEALARLNFIFFDDDALFAVSLKRLCDALATDIDWIRKHTAYGEAARHWAGSGRPGGLLLRSPVLEEAERWIASRPPDAPAPTEETQVFITESRRGATRRRNILTGSLAAGLVVALALAGLAYWQRGVAIEQRKYAEQALDAGIRTSNSLSLSLAMKLRNRAGIQSSLVKYLLDSALVLQDKLGSFGRNTPDLQNSKARALLEISLTLSAIGDNAGAFAAADQARQNFESLLAVKPDDPDTQLNLALSYEEMGDALKAQGKADDALAACRKAREIAQGVVDKDPANAAAQESLAVAYIKIGDTLDFESKNDEALAAYQMSLAIRQKLAEQAQGNLPLETAKGLAISYERVGNVLLAQGKRDAALAAFQRHLAIMQELADKHRDDTEVLRDLSVAYNKIGDVSLSAGKAEEALGAYQKALAIRQTLADGDKGNVLWQRDITTSYYKIGGAMVLAGKLEDAVAAFQKALAISQKLALGDPGNAQWQRDLLMSDRMIGAVLKDEGKLDAALKAYRDCLAIAATQTKAHPESAPWQSGLRSCVTGIGELAYKFIAAREFARGLEAAEQSLSYAPDMIWLYLIRAHALMFLDRTDEARALYLRYRGEKNVWNQFSWDELVRAQFAEFRKAGLVHPLMDEIEKQFADQGERQ